jgi:Cu(I)/Ag(I) efflux system protein CusF
MTSPHRINPLRVTRGTRSAWWAAAGFVATISVAQIAHAADELSDGEVRKLDKDTGRVTLKHGEIKNLDMPGMTMVFTAKDKALLDPLKVGDKVKFAVVIEDGKMVLTRLALAAP